MPDDRNEKVEIDFKGQKVIAVTDKAVKIGDDFYPKTQIPDLATLTIGQEVYVISMPRWLIEAKNLKGSVVPRGTKETIGEIIHRTKKVLGAKEVKDISIHCPHCDKNFILQFTLNES